MATTIFTSKRSIFISKKHLLLLSACMLAAAPDIAFAAFSHIRETELLGPYVTNRTSISTPGYNASRPAAIAEGVTPLYPARYNPNAVIAPPAQKPVPVPTAAPVSKPAPILAPQFTAPNITVIPIVKKIEAEAETKTETTPAIAQKPIVTAKWEEPKATLPATPPAQAPAIAAEPVIETLAEAPIAQPATTASLNDENTRLQLAQATPSSALAVPVPSSEALLRYQQQRGIVGGAPAADSTTPTAASYHVASAPIAPTTNIEPEETALPPLPENTALEPTASPVTPLAADPAPKPAPHVAASPLAVPNLQPRALPKIVKPATVPSGNKDIIEPGISYAPEPAGAAIVNLPKTSSVASPANHEVAHTPEIQANRESKNLSDESRALLARFPNAIDSPKLNKTTDVEVNRISPDITKIVAPKTVEASYEAAGIKIEVSRPGLDTDYELARAYDALMAGNTRDAIGVYRNILSAEPYNEEALFGLAATLHRIGRIEKARPLYATLLKRNPNHREALNNLLSLIGDEAPEDAIIELGHLRARNPDFSPIPAQMGLLYAKLGQFEQARAELLHAIALAPENLAYQYNLAVILDQQGNYDDAAALYASLLKANRNGANLPVDVAQIHKRYSFLSEQLTKNLRLSHR